MRFGVDYSCAPSRKKCIVVAAGEVVGEAVYLVELKKFSRHEDFESWLSDAKGVIAIDAPFGYPGEFCDFLGLTGDWNSFARGLSLIQKNNLVELAANFRAAREPGNKEPKRQSDIRAKSASAMKFFNPSVGRMAARLIPILVSHSTASLWPMRVCQSNTHIIEIYPALTARNFVQNQSYKNSVSPEKVRLRSQLLTSVPELKLTIEQRYEIINDNGGDCLDACFALLEACAFNPESPPEKPEVDKREGWIFSRFLQSFDVK
jgi:hypothetical protein